MNKLRFKLVFSKRLGMLVPIAEISRSHQKTASPAPLLPTIVEPGSEACAFWRISSGSVALLLAGCLSWMSTSVLAIDANTLPTGGNIVYGTGSIRADGNIMNVNTLTNKAIIRWDSFNIGSNAGVNFKMPDASSSVLNRVMGNSASMINGMLNANGHVYIVNQNGIYFGAGSQVNVGSLTATTLDNIANNAIENIYNNGILSNPDSPVFSFADAVGVIDVDKGASISTSIGGRVMLLAPDVKNSGLIYTPDGQTILAAGKTVYLSTLDKFAGLLVEVSSGGTATNLGNIIVNHGNASLVGLAVNQQGKISASTSVRANGSIYLKAKEIQSLTTPGNDVYGATTLGKDSVTAVTIDVNDKEEVIDAQKISQSVVDIKGRTITIDGHIVANSGQVNVNAVDNQTNNSSIYVGDHAVIDVSGVDATAPMSRNQLVIQLFSDQLRDSPALRGGALFGEYLYLDARKGTKIISQDVIDEAIASTTRTIAERSTGGGQLTLNAVNLVTKAGSTIDMSAGTTTYTGGNIRESRLLLNNKWILASEAKYGVPYQGINDKYTMASERWGESRSWALTASSSNGFYQPSYQEGGDAGGVSVTAANMLFQGELLAKTTSGIYQRGDTSLHASPLGGLFKLNYNNSGSLNFVNALILADNSFNENSPLSLAQKQTAEIDVGMLSNGISRLDVNASGKVNVNTAMSFQPHATVTLSGSGGVNVNESMILPSGSLTLSASQTADVVLANNVKLNVAGIFTNDIPGVINAMKGDIAVNGGNISINNGLRLGQGAALDASAGFWIDNQKHISTGHGGDITVTMADNQIEAGDFNSNGVFANGVTSNGGRLTVKLQSEIGTGLVKDIQLGGTNPIQGNTLWLSEDFFQEGGFSSYVISNAGKLDGDVLIGDSGNHNVVIRPEQHTVFINTAAMASESGTDLNSITRKVTVADGLRSPASLTVQAGDDLTLASNASIVTDTPIKNQGARGNVTLTSKGQMTILGDIATPAGDISLSIEPIPDNGDHTLPNSSFDNTLSLYLGEKATLTARAQYVTPLTSDGNLRTAFVTNAGKVSLNAGNGVLIAKEGSLIDVSGVSGNVDLPMVGGYARQSVAGNAGAILLAGRDGMALDGALMGTPSGSGEGGTLNIMLGGKTATGVENDSLSPLYFANGSRILTVTESKALLAANNSAGSMTSNLIDTSASATKPLTNAHGIGQISAEQISQGGFDNVSLKVDNVSTSIGDEIHFSNKVTLNVPSLITLDATTFSGAASLNTSTLVMTNTTGVTANASQLSPGSGNFAVTANFIDIQGHVAINDVAVTRLQSNSDIRGRGIDSKLKDTASLTAPGAIQLDAAQIYPSTGTSFTVTAAGQNSQIQVSNSANHGSTVPLSATGSITLNADKIVQAGVIRAPLGQITLNAKDNLTLSPNSVTSVSAEGSLIPYALTVLGGTELTNSPGSISDFLKAIDNKKITLNANNLDMQSGSRVDVSGSGDTFAFEWIQGIGGSIDVLSQSNYYAVLPALGNHYSPYDFLMSSGSDIGIDQAVYLSGGNGLAAGTYTLLPARYALVPGAFLISKNGTNMQLNTQLVQLDGSVLSSGYLTKMDGTSRGQYTSFNLINGNTFYKDYGTKNYKGLADYLITAGNDIVIKKALKENVDIPRLASDSGQLVLAAGNSLNLEGKINTTAVEGAKGALIDISSNDIRVVSTVDPAQSGVLQISANQLSNINADSVLLGGTRTTNGSIQTIAATANNVIFSNNSDHAVQLDELIVASKDTITLNQGAVVKTGLQSGKVNQATLVANGDGALLAVSAKNDFNFSRTGVTASPVQGKLTVSNGANLTSARSMVLDATAAFEQSGGIEVADGGTVTLGANQFSIGDQPLLGATKISSETLADFGRLSAMTFNSYKNIDINGATNFGNSALDITFNTAGISHHGTGDVNIVADSFVLKNGNNAAFTGPSASNGHLTVNANQIAFGETGGASTNIGGFNQVSLNASKDVRVAGTGTLNVNASQTNVNSAVITADSGARYNLFTTGSLSTQNNGQPVTNATGIGATLNLSATDMQLGGNLVLNAGEFSATARSGNLAVASGGVINVSAATVAFDSTHSATTDAGNIHLASDQGNVQVVSNALLNLSGGKTEGHAGTLQVDAKNGRFVIADGTLNGQAAKGEKTASLKLDVANLDNFSDVNKALESGHFNESRDIRVRSGDVTIATGDTVTAHAFTLGVDNGNATVAGHINADGSKGGDVAIYANGLVKVASTGQITARGQQANQSTGDVQTGSGGSVLLSSNSLSTVNAVSADSGALIDTNGYSASDNGNVGVDGSDGSVTLRGRRGTTGTANTVNVAFNTTAAIKGANEINIEGTRTYTANSFTATTMAGMITDTNNFYNANTSAGGYAVTQDGKVAKVLPHIEIRSTTGNTATDLTVGTDVNLRSFGAPVALLAGRGGSLTFRSNGNLTFNGSLSDGFSTATNAGILQNNIDTFNYNLIAGADYSAANITETNTGTGDFTLANNKVIRTGEGNITIAAGKNMTLGGVSSLIYTIGDKADDLAGFTKPASVNPVATATTTTSNGYTTASYVNNGGDISIDVRGNITGAATTQSVNQWLLRQGGNGADTSWWVRPDLFQQGIAALGGGNVAIQAGGNITNVSASSATNAQFLKTIVDGKEVLTSLVNGGGDVSISAGGNLTNGVYYAGRGNIDLLAGGSIVKSGSAAGTVIAMQDASANVHAKNNVKIETVFNPTLWVQGSALANNQIANSTFFNTYSDNSTFNVTSLAGNVDVGLSRNNIISNTGLNIGGYSVAVANDMAAIHPGTVNVTAFDGDINTYKMVLSPAANGNLSLFAAGSVIGGATSSGNINPTAQIILSDADLSTVLSVIKPTVGNPSVITGILSTLKTGVSGIPVHKSDDSVAVIIARDGDVRLTGNPTDNLNTNIYGIKSSKAVYINAGNNVTLHASIQHNNPENVSVIQAGNDFVMENGKQQARLDINGSGNLLIKAGRNIDLGNTSGILSLANTVNPNLSNTSANIVLLAGLGDNNADVNAFINAYINPTGIGPEQKDLFQLIGIPLDILMSPSTKLNETHHELLAYRMFEFELLQAGKDYIKTGSTAKGDEVIATLFPAKSYSGDMLMYQSQVRTSRDGNISMLAPGGLINAGVASNNSLQHDIGIVTEKGGTINAYANGDFLVNQSKVITQYGSDIMIFTNNGDIDAGRGSKSATSVPERVVSIDKDGNVTVEVKGVASGSGIRAQVYDPDGPNGPLKSPVRIEDVTVALFAPRGVLDAGEAGVAAGNLLVGATQVLNSSNITVAGTSTGVPVADTGSLAGSLAGVTSTAAGVSNAMTESLANQMGNQNVAPKELPPIVTVKTIRLED